MKAAIEYLNTCDAALQIAAGREGWNARYAAALALGGLKLVETDKPSKPHYIQAPSPVPGQMPTWPQYCYIEDA